MEFSCSIEINAPIEKVVSLFNDTSRLHEWQKGFQSFEPLSGEPGNIGAKSKIIFKNGKIIIELTETILISNLPHEMKALYEHKHMVNTMSNRFTTLDGNKTRYEAVVDYAKFIGLMPKLMMLLMPNMPKKQTQKMLDDFKNFAERN